jgi:hypothetical protein
MFKKKNKYENYTVFSGSVKNHQGMCGFYLSKNNLKTLDTPR